MTNSHFAMINTFKEGANAVVVHRNPEGMPFILTDNEHIIAEFESEADAFERISRERIRILYNNIATAHVKRFENKTVAAKRFFARVLEVAVDGRMAHEPVPEPKERPKAKKAPKVPKTEETAPAALTAKGAPRKRGQRHPWRFPQAGSLDPIKAYGVLDYSNRASILKALTECRNQWVSFEALVKAAYGSDDKPLHPLARLLVRSLFKIQEATPLSIEIRKRKETRDIVYYGLFDKG